MNVSNITTLYFILQECINGYTENDIFNEVGAAEKNDRTASIINDIFNLQASSTDTELFDSLDFLIGKFEVKELATHLAIGEHNVNNTEITFETYDSPNENFILKAQKYIAFIKNAKINESCLKNGNSVVYDLEYGSETLIFVGMADNLNYGKNCILMYGSSPIQAKLSDLCLK
jgi:hypothetical protein